jgi:hypothetical protein
MAFVRLSVGGSDGEKLGLLAVLASALLMLGVPPSGAAERPRPCGGINRAEGFEILAWIPETTCRFARAAARKVRYVAFHNEGRGLPDAFAVRVGGISLACRRGHAHRDEVTPAPATGGR